MTVERTSVLVDDALAGNPSGRRQGLLVYFEAKPVLSIAQHKGHTWMGWRP